MIPNYILQGVQREWLTTNFLRALSDLLQRAPQVLGPQSLPENKSNLLRALKYYPPSQIRCVILGQDPYPTRGKAIGLAFGVAPGYSGPHRSSILNIEREIYLSTGQVLVGKTNQETRELRSLVHLAKQQVLLLNTRLSVDEGHPLSHAGLGWEAVVTTALKLVAESAEECTWLLWGAEAREAASRLEIPDRHVVLRASHPCNHSYKTATVNAGAFSGCGHFADRSLRRIQWGKPESSMQQKTESYSLISPDNL